MNTLREILHRIGEFLPFREENQQREYREAVANLPDSADDVKPAASAKTEPGIKGSDGKPNKS